MREIRVCLKDNDAVAAALLRAQIERLGVPGDELVESEVRGKRRVSLFAASGRRADALKKRLVALRMNGVCVRVVHLCDSDWKTRWKRYFKPFAITPEVRVVPAWKKWPRVQGPMRDILVDTSVAFGTGLHATTRMMAACIRRARGRCGSFLDIGTGSGILALVAAEYGAQDIVALDNDPQAVATARRNFRRNGREAVTATADFGKWRTRRAFDFVAANLLTADLIRLRPRLVRVVNPGGYLAVSGIFEDNIAAFRKEFFGGPLLTLAVVRRAKWYCALFRREA